MALISNEQWRAICQNMIGLRSGSAPDDFGGASYAMDCAVKIGAPIPDDWDNLLMGTVNTIMAHQGYEKRYLMIVRPSTGTGEEYSGTFPKCSSKPSSAFATVLMGEQGEAQLVEWVVQNIPGQ